MMVANAGSKTPKKTSAQARTKQHRIRTRNYALNALADKAARTRDGRSGAAKPGGLPASPRKHYLDPNAAMLIGLHFPVSKPDARNANWLDVVEVLMARGVGSGAHMGRLLNIDTRRAEGLMLAARARFVVPEPESLITVRRASTISRFEELAASAWQDALASPDPMVRARFYSLALACYKAVPALGGIAGVRAQDPAGERLDADAFRKKYGLTDADMDALWRLLSPSTVSTPVPTNVMHFRDGDAEP